jgi:hypothetical protein
VISPRCILCGKTVLTLARSLAVCQSFYCGKKNGKGLLRCFKIRIHAVDSTVMQLFANCLDWVKHHRRKAAAKMRLRLDLLALLKSYGQNRAPMNVNVNSLQKPAIAFLPKRNLCLRMSRLAQLQPKLWDDCEMGLLIESDSYTLCRCTALRIIF